MAAGIFTIAAEKIYYLIKQAEMPGYGLSFAVIIFLNAFVIFAAIFFIVEIILFIIDCFRIKKIVNGGLKNDSIRFICVLIIYCFQFQFLCR